VLSAAEISRGVQGALGFLQRDPAAPLSFDNSMAACLRSFRVMALAAPLYAVYRAIAYAQVTTTVDETDIVLAEGLRYIVDWLLFPVIFYEVARRRGWLDRYPRYISALNWINLPALGIAIVGLILKSLIPAASDIIELAFQALFFYWFLMTTRLVLGVNWGIAAVLLVVDWVPSLFLSLLIARYLGLISVTAA
jgi:hypothetical protein